MGTEIERKFLVSGDSWRAGVERSMAIEQGYLAASNVVSVRIRIYDATRAMLTLKAGPIGRVRSEYEYSVPIADGTELMKLCGKQTLRKRRHLIPDGAVTWEVDVFEGRHQGLVLAEVELDHPDQSFREPEWLGQDVTEDPGYYNSTLAGLPHDDV